MPTQKPFPKFSKPPVNEVVFGVQFPPPANLQAVHLGGYWQLVKSEYPRVEEHIPIAHVIESHEVFATQPQEQSIVLAPQPPFPRMWFVADDKKQLIQVQSDRFLRNWRQLDEFEPYPSFNALSSKFYEEWQRFASYLAVESVDVTALNQCELTYINHLPAGTGWNSTAEAGKLFSFLSAEHNPGFLPEPVAIGWRTHYMLPEGLGRLHVSLKQGIRNRDKCPLFSLELTARGAPSREDVSEWFEVAHEWIVRGFAELTTRQMHEIWGRTQ